MKGILPCAHLLSALWHPHLLAWCVHEPVLKPAPYFIPTGFVLFLSKRLWPCSHSHPQFPNSFPNPAGLWCWHKLLCLVPPLHFLPCILSNTHSCSSIDNVANTAAKQITHLLRLKFTHFSFMLLMILESRGTWAGERGKKFKMNPSSVLRQLSLK